MVVCPPERCISESGRRIWSISLFKLKAFPWHDNPYLLHFTTVCDLGNEKQISRKCPVNTVIIRQMQRTMCGLRSGCSSFVLYTELESVGGPTKHLQWPGCAVRTSLSAQSTTLGQVPPGLNGPD